MLKVTNYSASNGIDLDEAIIVVNKLTLTETSSTILTVNTDASYDNQKLIGCNVRFSATVFKDESVFKGGGASVEKLMFENKHYSADIAYSAPLVEQLDFNSSKVLTPDEAIALAYEHIKKACNFNFKTEQD